METGWLKAKHRIRTLIAQGGKTVYSDRTLTILDDGKESWVVIDCCGCVVIHPKDNPFKPFINSKLYAKLTHETDYPIPYQSFTG